MPRGSRMPAPDETRTDSRRCGGPCRHSGPTQGRRTARSLSGHRTAHGPVQHHRAHAEMNPVALPTVSLPCPWLPPILVITPTIAQAAIRLLRSCKDSLWRACAWRESRSRPTYPCASCVCAAIVLTGGARSSRLRALTSCAWSAFTRTSSGSQTWSLGRIGRWAAAGADLSRRR